MLTIVAVSLTNDGNAILREIDVAHPAAKNMIELSRTQDEECGDGTTSVIILGAYVCSIICIIFFILGNITSLVSPLFFIVALFLYKFFAF
jgi:hypothetical protein